MAADKNGFDPFPGALRFPGPSNFTGPAELWNRPESAGAPWPINPNQHTTLYCTTYEGEGKV